LVHCSTRMFPCRCGTTTRASLLASGLFIDSQNVTGH
jgi:hypothetical protein